MSYDDPYEGARFANRPPQGGGQRRTKSEGPDASYAEVKERIQVFYATYPTGALQTDAVQMVEIKDKSFVMVTAKAYRTPDDPHPGTGTSWLEVPGRTPYTNGSEVENAETSAWGRAIAGVGILVDKGIASAQEIRSKAGGAIEPPSISPSEALRSELVGEADGATERPAEAEAGTSGPEPVQPVSEVKEEATPAIVAAQAAADAGGGPVEVLKAAEEAQQGAAHTGLSVEEFRAMAREKHLLTGALVGAALKLYPDLTRPTKAAEVAAFIEGLTDEQRLSVILVAIAATD